MSDERTAPLEGVPASRNLYRDALNQCPSVPHKHARAAFLLAWKGKEIETGSTTMLVVSASAQDLATDMDVSKANAVGILADLVFNGWLTRTHKRSQFIGTIPELADSGLTIEREYGAKLRVRMKQEWSAAPKKRSRTADQEAERLAALAERRRERAAAPAADTETVRTPDRNGQDPYPQTVRTHDRNRSGPMTDERSTPMTETVRTHDQTGPLSLYRTHPSTETPEPSSPPTGGTRPTAATAGGHPVPRPPAHESQGADEIPTGPTNSPREEQPQTAYAHDARETREFDPARRARLQVMPSARDLLFEGRQVS
ncbi:hypothetical protein ACIRLA_46630 [Streptomyces sp. NPDC102364]|uniref:hypothetical protein n=1 Tax=Streptomyces sp. NPDC102364 TaxID=3366161 RepID=UPI0038154162